MMTLADPTSSAEPMTVELMSVAEPTFAETVASLRARALAGEGNFRQALSCLTAAESLERQAGQYRIQRDAIKAQNAKSQNVGGNRIGIRMSHLAHAITRTIKQRDQFLAMAETALVAASLGCAQRLFGLLHLSEPID